jgi:hypothetical protein
MPRSPVLNRCEALRDAFIRPTVCSSARCATPGRPPRSGAAWLCSAPPARRRRRQGDGRRPRHRRHEPRRAHTPPRQVAARSRIEASTNQAAGRRWALHRLRTEPKKGVPCVTRFSSDRTLVQATPYLLLVASSGNCARLKPPNPRNDESRKNQPRAENGSHSGSPAIRSDRTEHDHSEAQSDPPGETPDDHELHLTPAAPLDPDFPSYQQLHLLRLLR